MCPEKARGTPRLAEKSATGPIPLSPASQVPLGLPPSGTGGRPGHRVLQVEREARAPRATGSFAHWLGPSRRPIPGPTGHMTKELAFADWLRAASLICTWGWGEPAHPHNINQTWQEGGSRWKLRVALSEAAGIHARRAQTTETLSSQEGSCRSLGRAWYSIVLLQLGPGDPALACFLMVRGASAKGRWKCEAVAASSPRT